MANLKAQAKSMAAKSEVPETRDQKFPGPAAYD
jgi:hypothetical protein